MADAALLRLDFALPFIAQLCTKVCLAAFSLSPNSDSPLTILSNRDEVHARPAAPVGWWRAGGEPLAAGRDLQAGGTWMAINKRLRWGIILNRPSESLGQKSRGELIPNWLDSDLDAASYLRQLKRQCGDYRPFSLIVGGLAGPVACLSTPSGEIYEYASGTSGFSNCEPGEGWGKIQALRDDLHASLQDDQDRQPEELLDLLGPQDNSCNLDVSTDSSQFPQSRFIRGQDYGTRLSTVLTVRADGKGGYGVRILEQQWKPKGVAGGRNCLEFRVSRAEVASG